MKHFSLTENILVKMKQVEDQLGLQQPDVQQITFDQLDAWHARSLIPTQNSDLSYLQDGIGTIGLLQPLLVVKQSEIFRSENNSKAEYIIIDGYRRYEVCKKLNHPVSILIKELTQEQAIHYLLIEVMEKRLSDYDMGMFYHHLLKEKYIAPNDLVEKTQITLEKLNRLLVFSKLPKELVSEIGNLSNVSYKTALALTKICQLGTSYQKALVEIADKIRAGFSEKRIALLLFEQFDLSLPSNDANFQSHYFEKVLVDDKVIMECKDNVIKIDKKLCKMEDYEKLIHTLSDIIKQWDQSHNE